MLDRYTYRGKRKDNGEWVVGNLIQGYESQNIQTSNRHRNRYAIQPIGRSRITAYEIDPDTLGQCTGEKDKCGVLIFDGDIIRCDTYSFENATLEVTWQDGCWWGYDIVNRSDEVSERLEFCDNIVIIGNVHDKEDKE